MTIYKTADGQLWTEDGLARTTCAEARKGWDEATQGPYSFNFYEWLPEALDARVVTEVEVND